jgi:hypothetical protein
VKKEVEVEIKESLEIDPVHQIVLRNKKKINIFIKLSFALYFKKDSVKNLNVILLMVKNN